MPGQAATTDSNGPAAIVRRICGESVPRAKSLIITVFGDAVSPHGGSVWLGSLIRLLGPFGLNERLVRTAVLRLSRDGWLTSKQIGRRSYYSLAAPGRQRFEEAHRRIYATSRQGWKGEWTLVFTGLGRLDNDGKTRLCRDLMWMGYGVIGPGVLAHPAADREALRHLLRESGLLDAVVVMQAHASVVPGAPDMTGLLRNSWDLDRVASGYRDFLDRFRPVWQTTEAGDVPASGDAFLVRTLLIHEFRRVLLRDPELPDELLPADWAGAAARRLCRNLYRSLAGRAEEHLMAILQTAEGPLPEAAPFFHARFGGLPSGGRADAA